jgi:uncharacterized protein YjiK
LKVSFIHLTPLPRLLNIFLGVIRYISGVGGIALDTKNMLLYLYKEKQPKEKNG